MEQGVVKWFDVEKGYGFIQSESQDKQEFFVHKSSIEDLARNLEQGERVQFEIGEGKKGPYRYKCTACSFRGIISRLFFILICLFSALEGYSPQYYLSICAVFRNEARFLREWGQYHRLMGVEHFYLFNNLSADYYYSVLEPYIKEGVVELINWPYEAVDHKSWTEIQCRAYNTLIDNRGKDTFWLAVIDTDEFIVPIEKEDIPSLLKEYEEFAGLGINWQHYGTSNVYRVLDNQTLIGSLTLKAPEDHPRNRFVKTIFQPKKIKKVKKPHHCKYEEGYFHVTENKEPFPVNKSLTDTISVNKIRINHYIYRDELFFYGEKRRRVLQWFPDSNPLVMNPAYNQIEDPILLPIAEKLEERLSQMTKPYEIE